MAGNVAGESLPLVAMADAQAALKRLDDAADSASATPCLLHQLERPVRCGRSERSRLEPQLLASCHLIVGKAVCAILPSDRAQRSASLRHAVRRSRHAQSLDRSNTVAAYLRALSLALTYDSDGAKCNFGQLTERTARSANMRHRNCTRSADPREFFAKRSLSASSTQKTTFISESLVRTACYRRGRAHSGSCHRPNAAGPATNPKSLKFFEPPLRCAGSAMSRALTASDAHGRRGGLKRAVAVRAPAQLGAQVRSQCVLAVLLRLRRSVALAATCRSG